MPAPITVISTIANPLLPRDGRARFGHALEDHAMQDQTADLIWREGDVPVSVRFDDPYFSLDNGLAETRHVFLGGNDLPGRFRDGFHIAELGFGTGLNLLTALAAWRAAGVTGRLHFTSFEAYPMVPEDMRRAQARFAELAGVAADLAPHWQGQAQRISLPDLEFALIVGDARETLSPWQGKADAWFLDGFSPAKNPELWEPALMAEVARHTVPGGTAASYTAAGFVRRGLEAAGFCVTRGQGYGRKRHMTKARKDRP
jgi:tRNA U34 5-methylaminomethyl-2-thiouridine-forming methyltransferase MnmC